MRRRRAADRPAQARAWRSSVVATVVVLAMSLPMLAYGGGPGEAGDSATITAQVTVGDPAPVSGHSAVSAHSHESHGWVYHVTPGVETVGRNGRTVIALGTLVRLRATRGISTSQVRSQLEPFSFADLGDGSIAIDRSWVQRRIVTAEVPVLGRVRCHEAMIPPLTGALTEIAERGLDDLIDAGDYGGCWVPRRIDWSPRRALSNHAWGLAIDFNVATNGLGRTPTLDRRIVDVFERWGFAWGGDWSRPDGMHFELVSIPGGNA